MKRLRTFDQILLDSFDKYFKLLDHKWRTSWDSSIFTPADMLDAEWRFVMALSLEIPDAAVRCASAFWYVIRAKLIVWGAHR